MIQVYTHFLPLIERLDTLFDDLDVKNTIEEIDPKKIVITEARSAVKILDEMPKAKVIVLSDLPSFAEGQFLLHKGIRGYGNTYMHILHLNQAIDMVTEGNIWLYPSFMKELIAHSMPKISTKDEILNLLTFREQETAMQVAEGKTNKEIAKELGITERTVKAHLTSIFEKTGANDRFALSIMLR